MNADILNTSFLKEKIYRSPNIDKFFWKLGRIYLFIFNWTFYSKPESMKGSVQENEKWFNVLCHYKKIILFSEFFEELFWYLDCPISQ